MRAFVTGGTGVVGRTFLPRLLADGWQATVLTRDPLKPGLPRHELLNYVAGDLEDAATVETLFTRSEQYDVIFHLAASLDYFGKLDNLTRVNAGATETMARFARHSKARRFVYASSVEAAGSFRLGQVPAGPDSTGQPLTAYGMSKVVAEKRALALSSDGISCICLRIGNVYGPGWMNFVVEFAQALLNRGVLWEYLPMFGNRYWSPVWNDDVADGLMAAAESKYNGVANLVGQAATVNEMFHFCADALGVPFSSGSRRLGDWIHVNLRSYLLRLLRGRGNEFGYIMTPIWPHVHRCSGMGKSVVALGWEPKMPLREGIRRNLAWAGENGLLGH
jgi:nucleoside-diphosphate-sugar epimerase